VAVSGGTNTSMISCLDVNPTQSGGTTFNVANGGTASGVDLLVSGTLIHGTSDSDTGVIKTGSGNMTLEGVNTYKGATYVNGGTLALGGSGNINTSTNVAVNSATLNLSGQTAPAGNNAQFSLTNATLMLGIPTTTTINETATTLNLGGTTNRINITSLPLTNSSPQIFHLIKYTTLVGNFNLGLSSLPQSFAGYVTNENNFVDLSVVASPSSQPVIAAATMNGGNFVFSGSNGVAGWPYWVLTSTNLTVPMTNWSLISTGYFDPYGNFVFTNPVSAEAPQNFYLLELP
jgi:autotransporter-associated beta strand protein